MTIESCLALRNSFVGGNINIPSTRIRVQCTAVGELSSWEGLPFRESQPHFNPTFLPAAAWTSPGKSVSLTGAAAAVSGSLLGVSLGGVQQEIPSQQKTSTSVEDSSPRLLPSQGATCIGFDPASPLGENPGRTQQLPAQGMRLRLSAPAHETNGGWRQL
jgi:hypothetical protein